MASYNQPKLNFVVETLQTKDGKKLGAIRPDAEGYYTIPVAVLGITTRNRTNYDIPSFTKQITEPDSYINMMLTQGTLYSEWGHPKLALLNDSQILSRLTTVDEERICCHFRKIWAGEVLPNGGQIVYADVKPTGPYGEYLKASLEDPTINTSFSLRSIAASVERGGIIYRTIKKLVTFDFVAAGGYEQASKRWSPSVEGLLIDIMPGVAQLSQAAFENFTKHEIDDVFGGKPVLILGEEYHYQLGSRSILSKTGELKSVFHEVMKTSDTKDKKKVSILSKVKKITSDHLGIEESKIKESSHFVDDLKADSLDIIELISAFEEEFGGKISDADAEKLSTVGKVVNYILDYDKEKTTKNSVSLKEEKSNEGDYGTEKEAGYADPGFRKDKKPRYPTKKDSAYSEERIRAGWTYINQERNQKFYSKDQVMHIKNKIIAAWKIKIDKDGPPAASNELFDDNFIYN